MKLRLETFGGLTVVGAPAGSGGHQRRRLAFLSLLTVSGPRGLSRDQVVAYLWSEKSAEDARHSLEQLLYGLRRAFGEEIFIGTNPIALNPDVVSSDVGDFEAALVAGALGEAVALYRGPFLAGFFLPDAPEFERWAETERARLAANLQSALEQLAVRALDGHDHSTAVRHSRQLAESDPLSARYALLLMRALDASGDRAAALRHARVYETLVRAEFDTVPDPTITDFADRLRSETGAPTRQAADSAPPIASARTVVAQSPTESVPTSVRQPRTSLPAMRYWYGGLGLVALLALGLAFPALRNRSMTRASGPSRPLPAAKSLEAQQLYALGQEHWNFRTDSSLRRSIDYFEQAIEKDPGFAAAYSGIAAAYAYLGTGNYADFAPRDAGDRAKVAVLRALALDDSLADAHATLGFVRMLFDYDFSGAEAEFQRALALDPASARTRQFRSILLDWMGRFDEAVSEARRAVALDTASVSGSTELARALFFAKRHDAALKELERARAIDSTFTRIHLTEGEIYAAQGRFPQAITLLRRQAQAPGRPPRAQALLGLTLARAGQRDEANRILEDLKARTRVGGVGAFDVATVYVGLGDYDNAFVWLDRAYDDRSLRPFIMDPTYEDLRRDRRFDVLLRRMGVNLSR